MNGMKRIGLMGGSFNPVHNGHLNMARAALQSGLVDEIVFLPTGNPPHKRAGLADKMDRLAMTQLAVAGEERMRVSREEIDRQGVIYTVDTLTRLHRQHPQDRLYYLIGADTLCVLHTWRRIDDVIRLCAFLVMMRPGEETSRALAAADAWRSRGADIRFLTAQTVDLSSTQVRERVRCAQPLAGLVPPAVEAYIKRHGLYSAEGESEA